MISINDGIRNGKHLFSIGAGNIDDVKEYLVRNKICGITAGTHWISVDGFVGSISTLDGKKVGAVICDKNAYAIHSLVYDTAS